MVVSISRDAPLPVYVAKVEGKFTVREALEEANNQLAITSQPKLVSESYTTVIRGGQAVSVGPDDELHDGDYLTIGRGQ